MSGNSAIDIQRVAAAAHYVVAKAESSTLGYIKLNKILWYSDLEHYRWHGTSITGLREYSRIPQGPFSKDICRAVGLLVKAGKMTERSVKVSDYFRREMVLLEQPDISMFTDEQIGILNLITNVIAPLTAHQLRQMTDDDPLCKEVENYECMLIATGSVITRPLTANGLLAPN